MRVKKAKNPYFRLAKRPKSWAAYLRSMGNIGLVRKLVMVPMNERLLTKLTQGARVAGYSNRSVFVRLAIVEKLRKSGVKISATVAEVEGDRPYRRP